MVFTHARRAGAGLSMFNSVFPVKSWLAFLQCAALVIVAASNSAQAAPINYGNFSGATVDFLQVTETANFPQNIGPKFGAPTVIGDTLDFNPAGFAVTGIGGSLGLMDVQLNFTIMARPGRTITDVNVDELGDFKLTGSGTAATQVNYALSLASIKVLEIDHVPLFAPITLNGLTVQGGKNLVANPGTGLWSLSADYDVEAALLAKNVSFVSGATKIELALDNTLTALSQAGSIAFVAKKDASGVVVTVVTIPEPASMLMLASMSCTGILIRRRRRSC
jgi:hypothetical protein